MTKQIVIDPVTRLEGHLSVRTELVDGRVAQAYAMGQMFRGFEAILRGRHPLDAQQITQRICGVCPVEHGIASILAQDMVWSTASRRRRMGVCCAISFRARTSSCRT